MSTKNRTRRTTTRSDLAFPNQMIEQINIALEQKGSELSAWVIEACRSETNNEKEHIHQLKDEE